jgi:hypothetical protein
MKRLYGKCGTATQLAVQYTLFVGGRLEAKVGEQNGGIVNPGYAFRAVVCSLSP